MKLLVYAALLTALSGSPSQAQPSAAGANTKSVTAEYYYRIKWGSAGEFKRLYERNHAPILRELQKQGFITKIEVEEPFTHLAGGER